MTSAGHAKIVRHVALVEEYFRKYEAERTRLGEPYADRVRVLWDLSHSPIGPADASGVFTARGFSHEEHQELAGIQAKVQAGLAEFTREHKPDIDPFDTPARIAEWIEEEEFRWSARRWALIESSGHRIPDQDKRAHDDAAAREAYREARARVMEFARIDPELPRLFPQRDDPVMGLQDIKVWTDSFSAVGRARSLREEAQHALRKAIVALVGSIEDAPVGLEFGAWTKPLIREAAAAATKLGLPAPLIFHDYVDMVRQAANSDETGISYIRYGAPNANFSQTVILKDYHRRNGRWLASAAGGLTDHWRRDVLRILRMWIRYLDEEPCELPPLTCASLSHAQPHVLAERVGPEYLDAFRHHLDRVPRAPSDLKLPLQTPEREVRLAFERLLGEPFHATDSGVEMCDMFTLQGRHSGQRMVVAAMFKGAGNKGIRWPLQMAGCGKNGNQVLRLFQVPADIYIVQANGSFDPTLVKHVHDTADARAARGHRVQFMLVDGVITHELLQGS